MSLNSQLQSLAEGYNNNITDHLKELASNQAQNKLNELNDIVSNVTNTENAGQLVGGILTAGKATTETILQTKKAIDKFKNTKPSEIKSNIEENVNKSSKETELKDLSADTGEELGEEAGALGLESFLGPVGLLLDVGTLATLGITTAIGLSKRKKEKHAENAYEQSVKQEQKAGTQVHTISGIVQATGQKAVGGVSQLD
jgi:hypothetical protein